MAEKSHERIIELARKLLAMTNSPYEHEADTAYQMLKRYCKQYNITIEELQENKRFKVEWDIMLKHRQLFFACCWNTIENWDGTYWHKSSNRRYIGIECTKSEQLELAAKFDWFVREYDKQLEQFATAFVHANQLYAKRTPEYAATLERNKSRLSYEDEMRLMMLIGGIKPTPFVKRLEAPKA